MSVFIWYQKLSSIYTKYRLIVESFGNLTNEEENELYQELKEAGFEIDKIKVNVPKEEKYYGEEVEFEIKYSVTITKLKLLSKELTTIDITVGNNFFVI